ncbi:hypothetical protein [Aureibaculum luteum]|uniref:hypothetical protein n=1 Tax=Aureibaculum luteum TaxID=1548456 RepID=UPI000E4FE864|nr:hypothetical protein [Aureibaculum luteum]
MENLDYFTRHVRTPYELDEILKPKQYRDGGGIDNVSISDLEEKLNSCFIKLEDWLKDELIKFIKDHLVYARNETTHLKKSIKALNKSIKKLEKEHPILDINNHNDFEIFNKISNKKHQVIEEEFIIDYYFEQKKIIKDWAKEKRKELIKINKTKRKEADKRLDEMFDRLSPENDGENFNYNNLKEKETIVYPFYCEIGALFAQGFITIEKKGFNNDYKFKGESFSDISKLSIHIKKEILKTEKAVRQYVNDTLQDAGQKNFYNSKTMMNKIAVYCNERNIETTTDFQNIYTKLNNLH